MTAPIVTAALLGGALFLVLVAPHLLARWTGLRRAPGEALAIWQSVSLTGVVCALLAAPTAALTLDGDHPRLLAAALVVSGLMLARLLWSGHRIGTDLRRMRAQHRQLVDLVGERLDAPDRPETPHGRRSTSKKVSVVAHASPTAYCLPGRRDRIVLSQGAIDHLDTHELGAVLAHEQAHLHQRHDLLLELFTVLHEAVPSRLRAPDALREVHLLAEMLADRAATHSGRTDAPTLGRALVSMARAGVSAPSSSTPGSRDLITQTGPSAYPVALPAGHQVKERLHALAAAEAGPARRAGMLSLATGLFVLPWALLVLLHL